MKDLFEQIKYLDATFLPIFGIDSIVDYVTEISVNDLKEDDEFLEKVNQEVMNLREYFPARDFSFHKTDNQIKTEKQAFSYLLKCLNIAKIPHDLTNRRNVMHVRLISENIVLKQYIEKFKMFGQTSEIRNSESENQNTVNGPWLNSGVIPEPCDPSGFVLDKQEPAQPQVYELEYDEFKKGVIDRDEVITFRVPLTSFFAKDRQIMNRHMRQNLKNVVINAEILGTNNDQREATNALINAMVPDISYTVSFMKIEAFKSKFEFGKPLFPENVYIPYKYQDFSEMSIHIDLPTDFGLKFNNSLVLSVDMSVFALRGKMRNMMIDGNYSLDIPFVTFDNKENGLRCCKKMIGVMYLKANWFDKDDVETRTWEIPQDVEFEDYYLMIDEQAVKCKEITKVGKNQESSKIAIMCLVSSDYQNVCAPLRNRYSIDAYGVEGDTFAFDIFINHYSDTFHDLKIRFPSDLIQNPKFTLVYQSKYGEDLESHHLPYELEREIENNTAHTVFAIKRYNREYMLHNYDQLCLVLRVEINKQEVPTVINYLDLITVENYWCSPMRRELFEYNRTYDFVETLKEPKTIRVWKQLMKSKRAHWKMGDDFKQVAYNSRIEKKQERIAKKEKSKSGSGSKGGNRGRPNRPATKAKGGRGNRGGNRGGRRGKVKRAQRSEST